MSLRETVKYNPSRSSTRLVRAAVYPITRKELRTHLRVPETEIDENEYFADLIQQATDYIEAFTNISMINQTFSMSMDAWPGYQEPWWDGVRQGTLDAIRENAVAENLHLPFFPLVSVEAVKVYDQDSVETSVNVATTFDVDLTSQPGRMSLKRGAVWPSATRRNRAIVIDYTAGYGTSRNDVPPTMRRAVLEMAAYLWTHRGDCIPEEAFNKSGAERAMRMYRVRRV